MTIFAPAMAQRWLEPGPYYSSYPTLGAWKEEGFDHDRYVAALKKHFTAHPNDPVHLYVHIPFCAKLCWYCICNIQVENKRARIQQFVDRLCDELRMLGELLAEIGVRPNVREVHLGGGTPSHLDPGQLIQVVTALSGLTDIGKLAEFAMEIDPRTVRREDLAYYAMLGIDRISFGVQDFNPDVQNAINRVQPYEMVAELLQDHPFKGANFDLLFGLPKQTRETFRKTVEQTISLSPSRVTLIKYAHAPEIRKHMKLIQAVDLPPEVDLPLMFEDAAESLMRAGYEWVGIDNFAKPDDDLAAAGRQRRVGRNFGGNTPGRTNTLIGVGPTTTSAFGRWYFQGTYDLRDYHRMVEAGEFPIGRGYELSEDEQGRRDVIFAVQCARDVTWSGNDDMREIADLQKLDEDGFIEMGEGGFTVTPLGRYFLRHICKAFDPTMRDGAQYKIHGP